MIFRKPSKPADQPEPEQRSARPGSKGRPTRSRREAEEARRRPLVPEDRKEARKRSNQKAREQRAIEQRALSTGDEQNMPAAHRGPERRFVRDLVDSRWNIAEVFFPVAIVLMLAAFIIPIAIPNAYMQMSGVLVFVLWGGILLCVVDAFVLRSRLRRALSEKFGGVGQGLVSYGIMRAIQIRRLRLPKPMIKHGEAPRR